MEATDPFIILARVGAPHGVKGEVRVKVFSEDMETLTRYGGLQRADRRGELRVSSLRAGKAAGMVVARFEGIDDRGSVEALNGVELGLPRSALPKTDEDEFYHADLIGLEARLSDQTLFGVILQVANFGADDLLEIKPEDGGASLYLPFTKAAVPKVDIRQGFVIVDPPAEEIATEQGEALDKPRQGSAK